MLAILALQNNDVSAVTGVGAGTLTPTAAASSTHGVTSTAAGTETPSAAASATRGVTSTSAGTETPTAAASSTHGVAGTSAGTETPSASAAGTRGVSSTSAGSIAPAGAVAAEFWGALIGVGTATVSIVGGAMSEYEGYVHTTAVGPAKRRRGRRWFDELQRIHDERQPKRTNEKRPRKRLKLELQPDAAPVVGVGAAVVSITGGSGAARGIGGGARGVIALVAQGRAETLSAGELEAHLLEQRDEEDLIAMILQRETRRRRVGRR